MSFFKQINQQIRDARHTAKLEAKEYGFPVLRSRGVEMNGYKRVNGSEISTNNEPWEIGSRVRREDIETFLVEYPETDSIWVSGGYDGHETVQFDDDYEPLLSDWSCRSWSGGGCDGIALAS